MIWHTHTGVRKINIFLCLCSCFVCLSSCLSLSPQCQPVFSSSVCSCVNIYLIGWVRARLDRGRSGGQGQRSNADLPLHVTVPAICCNSLNAVEGVHENWNGFTKPSLVHDVCVHPTCWKDCGYQRCFIRWADYLQAVSALELKLPRFNVYFAFFIMN